MSSAGKPLEKQEALAAHSRELIREINSLFARWSALQKRFTNGGQRHPGARASRPQEERRRNPR